MFDDQKNAYVPTLVGLGMLVQVHDPDDKELLSRVMYMLLKIIFVYRTFLMTKPYVACWILFLDIRKIQDPGLGWG